MSGTGDRDTSGCREATTTPRKEEATMPIRKSIVHMYVYIPDPILFQHLNGFYIIFICSFDF